MNQFLKNIVIFFLLMLAVNGLLYIGIKKVYFDEYRKADLSYHSFLLSDSHGLPLDNYSNEYGIYNFSAGSDSYFDMKRKVEYLIRNTKVDTIFITVDDHTLSAYREKLNNLDRSSFFTIASDYSGFYEFIKEKYVRGWFMFFEPKAGAALLQFLKAKGISVLKAGKKINSNNWDELNAEQKAKAAYDRMQMQFPDSLRSEKLTRALNDIIDLCTKNNISLIGLKSPLSGTYLDMVKGKGYGAPGIFLANGLQVMDFSSVYRDRDALFENQDHLNAAGGKLFMHYWANSLTLNR